MTASNIFICYRRDDSAAYAGRLYEDLRRRFLDHEVFMDLGIDLGEDFVEQVERAIESCAVLLVLIGPDWLNVTDDQNSLRLNDPDDLVRLEIAMALERAVLVIPLLVRGARMPRAQELPPPLAPLVRRTGLAIRDDRWDDDVGRLVRTLEQRLGTPPAKREASDVRVAPARWRTPVVIMGLPFRVAMGLIVLCAAVAVLYLIVIYPDLALRAAPRRGRGAGTSA